MMMMMMIIIITTTTTTTLLHIRLTTFAHCYSSNLTENVRDFSQSGYIYSAITD
jgi:hypothetical protein